MKHSSEIIHSRHLAEGDPTTVWGWSSPAGQVRAARRARLIISGAGLQPGMRVLELGCGSGLFTEYFAETGAEILALDISVELLALANTRCNSFNNVTFIVASAEDFTLTKTFDAIIGSSVLHHLDMEKTLPHMHANLSPRGTFCFAEPNMLNPQIFLQKNIPWLKKKLGDSPDETAFIRWSLTKKLKAAGFVDNQIIPFDWLHPLVPRHFISAISSAGNVLEKIPLVQEFAGSLLIQGRKKA